MRRERYLPGRPAGTSPSVRSGAVRARGPRIVVIDNYDSFIYNLVQALGELGCRPRRAPQRRDRHGRHRAALRPTPSCSRRARVAPRTPGSPRRSSRARRARPDPRGVPRPPGICAGVRRRDRGGARDRARQAERGRHVGTGDLRGCPTRSSPAATTRSSSDRDVAARRPRGHRLDRRRRDGGAAPHAAPSRASSSTPSRSSPTRVPACSRTSSASSPSPDGRGRCLRPVVRRTLGLGPSPGRGAEGRVVAGHERASCRP